jgi:hypothetical protein
LQVNARQDSTLKNPKTGQSLEVDIWISDLNLCFEFQVKKEKRGKRDKERDRAKELKMEGRGKGKGRKTNEKLDKALSLIIIFVRIG